MAVNGVKNKIQAMEKYLRCAREVTKFDKILEVQIPIRKELEIISTLEFVDR